MSSSIKHLHLAFLSQHEWAKWTSGWSSLLQINSRLLALLECPFWGQWLEETPVPLWEQPWSGLWTFQQLAGRPISSTWSPIWAPGRNCMHWSRSYLALITCLIIHSSRDWSCTDHDAIMHWLHDSTCTDLVTDHTLITWLIMHWSRDWSCTDHVTDLALITWLSCTSHVADHAMVTQLPCTGHMTDHVNYRLPGKGH